MSSPFCFFYIAVALPVPFFFLARSRCGRPWMAFWLPVACMAALEGGYWAFARSFPDVYEYGVVAAAMLRPLRGQGWLWPLNLVLALSFAGWLLAAKLPRKRPLRRTLPVGLGIVALLFLFSCADRQWNLLPRLFFDPEPSGIPARIYDVTRFLDESAPTPYFRRGAGSVLHVGVEGMEQAAQLGGATTMRALPVYADADTGAARLATVPTGQFVESDALTGLALPTVRRGWRAVRGPFYGAGRTEVGYVQLDALLDAFGGDLYQRLWVRYQILFQDYHSYRGANQVAYLTPDYARVFLPYEQVVLALALAVLLGAQVAALLRRRRE